MRGFDVFIEVARRLCAARRDLVVVCVGSDRVCYGDDLAQIQEKSFREHVLARVKIDPARIKFTGRLPPEELATLLSVSDLHLYLTAPFVLSWSMMNAMACGCTVLASDTPPVREVIEHGRNGLLAPYRDVDRFVSLALEVLEDPPAFRKTMGSSAIETINEKYSLKRVAPGMVELYQRAMDGGLEKSSDDASVPNARQSGRQPGRGLRALQKRHPWPKAQPVGIVAKRRWLGPDAEQMLAEAVGVEPRIVLQLGAWCGHSTRQLAERWPGCHIIAVDHWPGCRRKEGHPDWKSMLSEPYLAFLRNCWEWRRRITALRLTFVDAVREVAEHGIAPDVVCAELDYDSAMALGAMHCIRSTFRRAIVVGIGWHWWGVREAVLSATLGEELEVRGDAWCLRPRSAVGARPRSIESGRGLARV